MSSRDPHRRARAALLTRYPPPGGDDEARADGARLLAEIERLRAENVEADARYRLLQSDQAALRKVHRDTTRHATGLQAECHRLATRLEQLQAQADHPGGPSGAAVTSATGERPTVPQQERSSVKTFGVLKRLATSRAALPACVAAVLLVRDPALRDLPSSIASRLNPARWGAPADGEAAGYLGYARLVNARDAYDEARALYNASAETLKGDALLEAQDALRSARSRYQQARASFLPALRDACSRADVPFPGDPAALLAATADGPAPRD